jgi:RHS repeat-associated protein
VAFGPAGGLERHPRIGRDHSGWTKTLTDYYDDASDETAWASTLKPDGTTVTKRYVDGIDGNLAATVADDGTVKLDLTNLHGDTVATIDPTATSIGNYHETTEYGLPRDPATAADDYGWLGGKKRSSDDLGGLTLMGVRLYNPATGRFGSVDPIPGGNANAYTYPTDPINGYDLTGKTTRQMDDTNPSKTKKAKKKKSMKAKHGGLPSGHKISMAYPPIPGHYSAPKKHKKESKVTHVIRRCEGSAGATLFGFAVSGLGENPPGAVTAGISTAGACVFGGISSFWD